MPPVLVKTSVFFPRLNKDLSETMRSSDGSSSPAGSCCAYYGLEGPVVQLFISSIFINPPKSTLTDPSRSALAPPPSLNDK